jgi:opacity protein-like surface antigen
MRHLSFALTAAPPPPPPRGHHYAVAGSGAFVHDGFYFRVGLGVGGFNAKGSVTPDNGDAMTISGGGLAFDLLLGGTIAPGFVLGGGFIFQQTVKPDVSLAGGASAQYDQNANFGVLGPFLEWYPNPRGGFHVNGMIGLAAMTLSDPNTGESKAADRGVGLAVGAGYDFWVAPQWSLGLGGRLFGGSVSNTSGGIEEKFSVAGFTLSATALLH